MNLKQSNGHNEVIFSKKKKQGLTSFDLKMIATVTMLFDHIAVILVHSKYLYYFFRAVGRVSFPIYSFLLVEGFFHTKDRKKYAGRLAIFALISEIPYDLAFQHQFFEWQRQNIFLTLLIGLLAVWGLDSVAAGRVRYPEKMTDAVGFLNIQNLARFCIMIGACGAGYFTKSTYSYAGIFLIMCFYIFHGKHRGTILVNAFFNVVMYGGMQSFGTCSAIPIAMYNGQSGSKKWKWFFYIFYPAHLLILFLINIIR